MKARKTRTLMTSPVPTVATGNFTNKRLWHHIFEMQAALQGPKHMEMLVLALLKTSRILRHRLTAYSSCCSRQVSIRWQLDPGKRVTTIEVFFPEPSGVEEKHSIA